MEIMSGIIQKTLEMYNDSNIRHKTHNMRFQCDTTPDGATMRLEVPQEESEADEMVLSYRNLDSESEE